MGAFPRQSSVFAICVAFALVAPEWGHTGEFALGPKADVGHFSYAGQDYTEYLQNNGLHNAFKLGFAAGGFLTLYLTNVVEFQAELLVLWAGDGSTGDASYWDTVLWGPYDGLVTYIDRITYLEMPILIRPGSGRSACTRNRPCY